MKITILILALTLTIASARAQETNDSPSDTAIRAEALNNEGVKAAELAQYRKIALLDSQLAEKLHAVIYGKMLVTTGKR